MRNMQYPAFRVQEEQDGTVTRKIVQLNTNELPQNGVLVKVKYSSLNYKDALSAIGNKGVTRNYPHTPGIDAAGVIEESTTAIFNAGDEVIVTGYDLGMNTAGGFGGYINVPAEWLVPKPDGLTLEECMILGTAGFTAALSVHHLIRNGQRPEGGPILVTGATGGVGSLAISILASQNFEVIASTGKSEQYEFLKRLGAAAIVDRDEVNDPSSKALLKPRWAGAIDTVGGNTLSTILKACAEHGNVCVCGNVSTPLLNTTVFPFILNGVNLLGINSATTPMKIRREIWSNLASLWKPAYLHEMKNTSSIFELEKWIQLILKGQVSGRVLISHEYQG